MKRWTRLVPANAHRCRWVCCVSVAKATRPGGGEPTCRRSKPPASCKQTACVFALALSGVCPLGLTLVYELKQWVLVVISWILVLQHGLDQWMWWILVCRVSGLKSKSVLTLELLYAFIRYARRPHVCFLFLNLLQSYDVYLSA